jgi:hypothetical protein
MPTSRYLRLVWFSALYDLLVTLPFATPWTARIMLAQLRELHVRVGAGGATTPPFEPLHFMFLSFFGTIVTMWAIYRLLCTRREHGLVDGCSRIAFAFWEGLALWQGQSHLLFGFLAIEIFFGVMQLAWFPRARSF